MKTSLVVLSIGFWSALAIGAEQKPSDPHSDALKVLRRAVEEYERNPNAARARTNLSIQPETTVTPTPPAPGAVKPPEARPAPAITPAPATTAVPPATTSAPGTTPPQASFAEMEKMYLEGKITAKQFQKYLQEIKVPPPSTAATAPAANTTPPATTVKPTTTAPTSAPATTTPNTAVSDVERRLDDLLRAKAEREKAATNAAPATATSAKTKRQRLDDLLRQYIDGKISDAEYKSQREKVIAEPE